MRYKLNVEIEGNKKEVERVRLGIESDIKQRVAFERNRRNVSRKFQVCLMPTRDYQVVKRSPRDLAGVPELKKNSWLNATSKEILFWDELRTMKAK